MFNGKEKDPKEIAQLNNTRNILSASIIIEGEINAEGDFRIDGKIKGSINTSGKLVIGKNGLIEGNVTCHSAEIEGVILGKVDITDILLLKTSAKIEGELTVSRLSVEPGASYNGTCIMRGASGGKTNIHVEKPKP